MVLIDEYTFMSMRQFPLFMVSQAVLLLFIMVGSVVVAISVVNIMVDIFKMQVIFREKFMLNNILMMHGIFRENFMLNNIVMSRLVVLLNQNIMGKVMERLTSSVILVNDMVFLVTMDVVLSHRSIWVDDFGLMAHVRGRVVHEILGRVVRVLMIHNRLVMNSFIMLLMVLDRLFVVIVNIAMG